MGIPAIAITDEEDEEFTQQVLNGNYGSPESLLSTESWSIFDKDVNRSRFRRGSLHYTMVCSYNLQPVDQAENKCGVLLIKFLIESLKYNLVCF